MKETNKMMITNLSFHSNRNQSSGQKCTEFATDPLLKFGGRCGSQNKRASRYDTRERAQCWFIGAILSLSAESKYFPASLYVE